MEDGTGRLLDHDRNTYMGPGARKEWSWWDWEDFDNTLDDYVQKILWDYPKNSELEEEEEG